MKDVVKAYIKNNITLKNYKYQQTNYPHIKDEDFFRENDLKMNYRCLLDMKSVPRQYFDKEY